MQHIVEVLLLNLNSLLEKSLSQVRFIDHQEFAFKFATIFFPPATATDANVKKMHNNNYCLWHTSKQVLFCAIH